MNEKARKTRDRLVRWTARLTVRCAMAAALLALLATLAPWPVGVRPVMAEHKGLYLVCPDPILEGNSAHMQIRMKMHHTIGAGIYTFDAGFTADGGDFAAYNGVWMIGDSDSDSLWVPVITHEDSKPERDETFAIGVWKDGDWMGCEITIIDDDSPEITDVEISSKPVQGDRRPNGWTPKPNDWDTYRAGESIDVTVTFDSAVEVDGSPLLSLYLGDGDASWRGARYHSGSGSELLTFRYQVQPADRDDDGISVGSASEDDDRNPTHGFSGTIYARGTDAPIRYSHEGLGSSPDHKVDGRPWVMRAQVTSTPPDEWEAYRANQIIEISMTFDIDVEVSGEASVEFYIGSETEASRHATYARGSGTDTLVFAYTVQPGDTDPDGIRIALGQPGSGFGGSGTITARGTDVEPIPYYLGTDHLADHKVDAVAPDISSVTIRSRPSNGESYRAGEVIEVAVGFSETVRISGEPQIRLDIGGVARQAALAGDQGSSDAAVFHYTVVEDDADADGIGIGANSLRPNGGGIHDGAGNAAGLSHEAVAATEGQRVDTSSQG